jgi:hypothetical protein
VTFSQRILSIMTAAGAAAALTALMAWPRGTLAGAGICLVLLLPITVACCALLTGSRGLVQLPLLARARRSVAYGPRIFVGFSVFGLGAWAANSVLAEAAFQSALLMAYGVLAVVAALTVWRAGRSQRFNQHSEARLSTSTMAALSGAGLGVLDTHFYPYTYTRLHIALLVIVVLLFCIATSGWVEARPKLRWEPVVVGVGALTLCLIAARASGPRIYRDMLRSATSQQRLLSAAHSLLDRDRDGFASALGGGDCDDRDRDAFPLSFESDCLGWATRASEPPERLEWPSPVRAALAPEVVVLLTIDAFRCGFERDDPLPALRAACPELTRLAKAGRLRLDAHTTFPRTDEAMGSLNTGAFRFAAGDENNRYLADWFASAGYKTHAISTTGNQFPGNVQQSFQTVDLSLRVAAAAARAEAVNVRLLQAIHEREPGRPLFVWAHYFDAHAPYVTKPGSIWAIGSDEERYVSEIRRVDAAIGRLAQSLSARADAERIVVFVTADHGEEFGAKGSRYHGFSLAEEAIRVPMLVWSPSPAALARTPADLPISTAEVGSYLAAIVSGSPFQSREEAFFMDRSPSNVSLGLYRGGWKLIHHQAFGFGELYDLSNDPLERSDLIDQQPERRRELGARLAGYVRAAGRPQRRELARAGE